MVSTRAKIITRRAYNRPLDESGTVFESWHQTIDRVIEHQRWLWERAAGTLSKTQKEELAYLRSLLYERKAMVAGRTLFLGGTETARKRECSQFNCSYLEIKEVDDMVDAFWLLLNGCGVGFKPVPGKIKGFTVPVGQIDVIRRDSADYSRGRETTLDWYKDGKWVLSIGDSAEGWARSLGILLNNKNAFTSMTLDVSQIRHPGGRLKGYGWICSGSDNLVKAYIAIVNILSKKAGQCLDAIDILDILNHVGTVLSSRRSAEIALHDYGVSGWEEFAKAKKNFWKEGNNHRAQSNNSLVFHEKPTKEELRNIFDMMIDAGGSEPGFINAQAAKKRADYFSGVNPCAEILLPDKGFCNLVEVNVNAFENTGDLQLALYYMGRANYRQTCVNLLDGVLSSDWHDNNEWLRLCGVGITGLEMRPELWRNRSLLRALKTAAIAGAASMAKEIQTNFSKRVTTIKPSGTISKIMDCTEGIHKPLGKYIFNNVLFSKHDPILDKLIQAGYRWFAHPFDPMSVLVTLPVSYENVQFDSVYKNGQLLEINKDSAVQQLEKYRYVMEHYVEHNCSITISYDVEEVEDIVDWLYRHWDVYVGVSFLFRHDPTKTAEDLGYSYLPQEVVTKDRYYDYVSQLKEIDLDEQGIITEPENECATGNCPIR